MTTLLKAKILSGQPGLSHGFFTRAGGVSEGIYAQLNCGFGSADDPEAVTENRKRVLASLPGVENLCIVYQVHSADVVTVEDIFDRAATPRADAMVTCRRGIALGILTADCVPVLFADTEAQVIGAAHAGWKGAIDGILQNTVTAMKTLGAARENIVAAIGPCIAQQSYEVGPDLYDIYLDRDDRFAVFFTESRRPNHFLFDLTAFAEDRLLAAGLSAVERLGLDTYKNEDRFYSYRRSTHQSEPDFGRQISAIALS